MKHHAWTLALASAGVVSMASVAYAEEQAMSQVLTAVSSTTIGGYVDTSAIWRFGSVNQPAAPVPGRPFDNVNKMDGFNLNVVQVTIEKPLSDEDWSAGYRADILFGPDAAAFDGATPGTTTDLALRQAYVNLGVPVGNGLDFKMGVFNTIVGYEVFDSHLNPNYSRSYGYTLEPLSHTGLLMTYQLSEAASFMAGVANTLSQGVNVRHPYTESAKTYMAALSIAAPDSWGFMSGSSFYVGIISGFGGNYEVAVTNPDGSLTIVDSKNTVNAYAGVSVKTGMEGLSVGGAFDYRFNGVNAVSPGSNYAWAVAGYLTYAATDKLRFSGRLDYTVGSDGTYFDAGVVGTGDDKNELLGITGTMDYNLWANVTTRAELRWDTALGDEAPFNGLENIVTATASVVYQF